MRALKLAALAGTSLALLVGATSAADRARDLGIPFEGTPGPLNAITDVAGVEVGHVTLIEGEGALEIGVGPIRTGVTVVLPRGKDEMAPVFGGFFNLNGNGEMTGQSYIEDFGLVYGPIGITNTNAIGDVYAGIQRWTSQRFEEALWPVVAETWDGVLNDLEGFHVTADTAIAAIDSAATGAVAEGNVGGGTGMRCFGFKGGIGTSSRVFEIDGQSYALGVLVQCNTGARDVLRIAGVPVGQELADSYLACFDPNMEGQTREPLCKDCEGGEETPDEGSIVIVIGTDAPLTPLQLDRVARRAPLALGRLGSFTGNGSGDLIVSFSTSADVADIGDRSVTPYAHIPTGFMDTIFRATVEATEEAIVNSLVSARLWLT